MEKAIEVLECEFDSLKEAYKSATNVTAKSIYLDWAVEISKALRLLRFNNKK